MSVNPVAGSGGVERRQSTHGLYTPVSFKSAGKISHLSNLLREVTTSRIALVAVISAVIPACMICLLFEPRILFEDVEFSKFERHFLAVLVYRLSFETFLCIIRCSYHKASAMTYLHERKIQNSVEIVLYALFFIAVEIFMGHADIADDAISDDISDIADDEADDDHSAASMIMWGTMIEAIALASDAAYHDTEACIESPLVHLIILPIMYSFITWFFFVVMVIYLQLTTQSNNDGILDEESGLIGEVEIEREWRGDTLGPTLDRYCNNTSADDPDTDTAFSFSSAMSNFDFDLR